MVHAIKECLAEAFINSSGSMAETLRGYHKQVKCPRCGLGFAVNASAEVGGPKDEPGPHVFGCACPNCRQQIYFPAAPAGWKARNPGSVRVPAPTLSGGDRFLLGKGLLGPRAVPPGRLDLVVFQHQRPDRDLGPAKVLYVKRLFGLPGETVAIHLGRAYRLPVDKGLHYDDVKKARGDVKALRRLWRPEHMHRDDAEAARRFRKGEFQIIRKGPETVLALRRLVYDHDHPAKDLKGLLWQRWAPGRDGAWLPAGDHAFRHASRKGPVGYLRYRHVLRGRGGAPQLITDFTGYNTWQSRFHTHPGENWVSDLILECEAVVEKAGGELRLELSKGRERFQARFDLADGTCALFRLTGRKEERLGAARTAAKGKGTYRLRLANVDDRLTVWVDDALPFGEGLAYAPAPKFGPTKENDLEPASVGAAGAAVTVRKLRLHRAPYYTTAARGSPHQPDVDFDPANPDTWGKLSDAPVATFHVQAGHYFLLGDNSQESSDSRSWGVVPDRLLLGKAFFVYYPFGRAGRLR
jgi:signal peptidase I